MLVGVENKKTLNVKNANGEISCMAWVQEKTEPKIKDILNLKDDDHNDYMKYIVSIDLKFYYINVNCSTYEYLKKVLGMFVFANLKMEKTTVQ